MKAVIIIGHGSTKSSAAEDFYKIVEALGKRLPGHKVEPCFLSRMAPDFHQTVEKCVLSGAEEFIVIPYLLLKGTHVDVDIPRMIALESKNHPEVKFTCGQYLGYDDLLVELLLKRIKEI